MPGCSSFTASELVSDKMLRARHVRRTSVRSGSTSTQCQHQVTRGYVQLQTDGFCHHKYPFLTDTAPSPSPLYKRTQPTTMKLDLKSLSWQTWDPALSRPGPAAALLCGAPATAPLPTGDAAGAVAKCVSQGHTTTLLGPSASCPPGLASRAGCRLFTQLLSGRPRHTHFSYMIFQDFSGEHLLLGLHTICIYHTRTCPQKCKHLCLW